ncbi:MAG: TetR/AcrR family transcriptional regulator [Acidobacteria bacterium]|nr:TetR/AcrR family transcriptional regulator [Acidobacteriota bacterium]
MTQTLTRERILEKARAVFARYGFRKTSLNDIVRDLGVTKTAIYHHFPGGKSEIIDAVLAAEEGQILEAMRRAIGAEEDPAMQLRQALLAKIAHLRTLREVLEVSGEVGEEVSCLYESHERRFKEQERALFEEILREGQEAGIFRDTPREQLARGIQSAAQDVISSMVFSDDAAGIEANLDQLLDVLFFGIIRRVEPGS